ncbi:very short patch repair endonuclease [Mesorhizobium dulcispinae]|uniref:very short patch repair endonuclease n=1 Tax=Mesorhizobium dulcispinae TaxID=3072316 RepID=UPI002A247758|nr:very short patch repair endonuclease [Mesorhizobium sp. VK23D]MDX8518725.1 very short patch repair endonuclease [Mesorhizobium sp. VK23D]
MKNSESLLPTFETPEIRPYRPGEPTVSSARSALMARVRGANTKPELIVRRAAHALGYRFRLHRRDLPGSPDLVFPRLRVALFVHGCFWHRHENCRRATTPKTRTLFWSTKFEANVRRDQRVVAELAALGWRSEIIWECETINPEKLRVELHSRLGSSRLSRIKGGNH